MLRTRAKRLVEKRFSSRAVNVLFAIARRRARSIEREFGVSEKRRLCRARVYPTIASSYGILKRDSSRQ